MADQVTVVDRILDGFSKHEIHQSMFACDAHFLFQLLFVIWVCRCSSAPTFQHFHVAFLSRDESLIDGETMPLDHFSGEPFRVLDGCVESLIQVKGFHDRQQWLPITAKYDDL